MNHTNGKVSMFATRWVELYGDESSARGLYVITVHMPWAPGCSQSLRAVIDDFGNLVRV